MEKQTKVKIHHGESTMRVLGLEKEKTQTLRAENGLGANFWVGGVHGFKDLSHLSPEKKQMNTICESVKTCEVFFGESFQRNLQRTFPNFQVTICHRFAFFDPPKPWKINMEPKNHPFRKEHDLPNLHDYVPC